MREFIIILATFLLIGCSADVVKNGKTRTYYPFASLLSGSNKTPLTVSELEDLIETSVMRGYSQVWMFLPDNKLVYIDDELKNKGLWYIKTTKVPHRNYEEHAMLCTAESSTSINDFEKTYCSRIFKERGNKYSVWSASCDLNHSEKTEQIECGWFDNRGREVTFIPKKKFLSSNK